MKEFFGWAHSDSSIERQTTARHLLTGKFEAPDSASETWINDSGTLGQTLPPTGEPPLDVQKRKSEVAVVGNVRLDEPGRLSDRIGLRSPLNLSESDALDIKLVHAAYSQWGLSFVEHLQGAFAFVIWNPENCQLIAARDPFGREPLFVHDGAKDTAVASNPNILRRLPTVSEKINETRVADFLMSMHKDKRATFYDEIRRLPPGHLLVTSDSGTTTERYRTLSSSDKVSCTSDDEYAEAYRSHFFQAVRRSIRGGDHLGTCLSGGLDSSSITCATRDLLPSSRSVSTFSLTFDAVPDSDERNFVEAVHQTGEYDAHFVAGDEEGPLDTADELLRALGLPFPTSNLFLSGALYRAARTAGADVVLDGFLGDSVTGHGTTRVTELALRGQWLSAIRELRAAARQLGPSPATYWSLFRQHVSGPLVTEPLGRAWRNFSGKPLGDKAARRVIQPDLLRRLNWEKRARSYGVGQPPPVREQVAHEREVTSWSLGLTAETAVRTGRYFDVSVRFPFADEDLISFCLALPPRQKCRNGWTRVVARKALRNLLPESVACRHGKTSLAPVFARGFLDLNREKLRAVVYDQIDKARTFVRPGAVRRLFHRCVEGEASHHEIRVLWNVVLLTRWIALQSKTM